MEGMYESINKNSEEIIRVAEDRVKMKLQDVYMEGANDSEYSEFQNLLGQLETLKTESDLQKVKDRTDQIVKEAFNIHARKGSYH